MKWGDKGESGDVSPDSFTPEDIDKHEENCWLVDGCDININIYTDYLCNTFSFKL